MTLLLREAAPLLGGRRVVSGSVGKEHLRDIEKMSEQHALCIDATRVAPAHLKSRGNQVDRMMDQLGKAVINWTEVLALVEPTAAITPTTTHFENIDATRVAPAHLKSRGNQVDRMMDQLGKAVINWTEVLALVEPTAAITPTTTHFENKTIGWIEEYEQKIKDLDESFRGSNVFSMEVGHDDALKMLDTNEKVFVEETKIFEKNAHLCVVFEFPEKINTSQEILQTMQKTVVLMRAAWGVSEDITCFITDAKALLWRELEDSEDGAKAETKKLSGKAYMIELRRDGTPDYDYRGLSESEGAGAAPEAEAAARDGASARDDA
ncbi:hypothetical protein AURANDRAFT_60986 [Aureococcus anophagefferens]|uniref:Dynein heavy chain linker domain-containing protein n=1 Tax=Aureococcus anophagefferens TaxID=44056 RepID=F0XX06_AURAN|nr:hypothetical protein AURANDRAFT_60986 [Aureococcus anophagefferens]EGB12870.1 hypothetical protein AURANDRAFT_60986 [Aureococcus anophagefferens]|eukprot:XP_009032500.1 hypothetical protein AURANDRAFT_60986 [Aureococcus anophagefferens]